MNKAIAPTSATWINDEQSEAPPLPSEAADGEDGGQSLFICHSGPRGLRTRKRGHVAAPLTCPRTIFTFARSPEQAGATDDQPARRAIYHNETPPLMRSSQRLSYVVLVATASAMAMPAG